MTSPKQIQEKQVIFTNEKQSSVTAIQIFTPGKFHSHLKTDLWVEIFKTQWLKSGDWGCPLDNGPKLAVGSQIVVKKG